MKDRFLFLIFCFSAMGMFAQETEGFSLPNYAAKTPEAAAFLKYGEYPVNLSTGVPNISIPLYNIQIPGYSLPITLDYHASGIRVDQESSWVGLGWNVNYGAQIILSARDEVDENNSRIDDMPTDADLAYYEDHPYYFDGGPIVGLELDKSRVKDVYQFSSPTASGQFYIRDGSTAPSDIVVYPPDAFKVEAINGIYDLPASGRERFKVTDPQGNVYIFRTSERSYRKETHHDFYKSAWYVDEIRTSNNQTIYFTYEDDGVTAEHNLTQKVDITASQKDCNCPTAEAVQHTVSPILDRGGTTYTYVKRIKEITFNNGNSKVVFNRINDRQDLKSGIFDVVTNYSISRLSSLEVRHRADASSQTFNLVKGYSFDHGYFNADETGTDAYKHKRLRLDRVMTLLEGYAHEFIYNTDHDLPEKGSFSKDIYGYFNGAVNYNLIPQHDLTSPYDITIGSADRRVNPQRNQVGILKEIHYPTKGWTKFNYETNQFYGSYNNAGFEEHTTLHGAAQGVGPGGLNPTGQEETDPGFGDPYTSQCQDPDICVRYYQIPFYNLNPGSTASITATLTNSTPSGQTPYHHMYGRVRIFNGSSTPVYDSGSPRFLSWSETVDNISLSGDGVVVIEAWGEYIHMAAALTYHDPNPKNINAGGLRVADIENYDHDGSLLLKKIYDYNLPSNPEKTSGKSVSGNVGFNFTSEIIETYSIDICPTPDPGGGGGVGGNFIPAIDYNHTYSISSEGTYGISGNSIVYEYVKEKQVDSLNNALGYTLHKFTTGPDTYVNPTLPITLPWKRGKLLEKSVYKTINGEDYIQVKEENIYVEDNSRISYVNGFQMRRFAHVPISEDPNGPFVEPHGYVPECGIPTNVYTMVSFQKYNLAFPWYYLSNTKNTNYYYNSQNNLIGTFVSETDYTYSNPVHLQLSKTTTTTSDGKTLETRLYYPGDAAVQSEPNVASLIAKNMLSTPLKTQTYLNGSKLQEQKTKYKSWPSYDAGVNLILPEIIQGAKENDALENRIVFVQRDKAGNPVEVKLENGVSVCYIWAYNDSQVVAKIENATYTGISPTLVQNIKDASVTGTEQELISELNQLRLLPNAMVTTYTYLPLVGISTITDPRGYKTTYDLDNQSRLRFVKDQEDNILLENQYHYKN